MGRIRIQEDNRATADKAGHVSHVIYSVVSDSETANFLDLDQWYKTLITVK